MSEAGFSISKEDDASDSDAHIVWQGLADYNRAFVPDGYARLRLFLRDPDGRIAGGLLGEIHGGWLHVEGLWLEEPARRHGYGSRLLQMAEDEARRRGCRYVYLDTLSFQARPFYERHGYQLFATQEDYPVGHERYFMRKTL